MEFLRYGHDFFSHHSPAISSHSHMSEFPKKLFHFIFPLKFSFLLFVLPK